MNLRWIGGLCFVASIAWLGKADAMPPFAQAYGLKCSACHTAVPALNAYGRYVQRTGYASLDPQTLRRAFPLWFGENASYDQSSSFRTEFGNVALHGVGAVAHDWTYHLQQWITQGGANGDLDTFWLAYNNVFHRDGHIFAGKIEAPGPSPFSQWMDLAAFNTPEITVGEHAYQLDGNRWGAKINYVRNSLDLEAGWLGSNGGWSGSSDFANDTDKTFQWKVASANGFRPLEYGIYGSRGSVPLAEGGFDQYHSLAAYVQNDSGTYFPGVLLLYQRAFDANPGNGSPPANSTAVTYELYKAFFRDTAALGVREEFTNDGLGNTGQSGNLDLTYQIAPYLHLYVEDALTRGSTPAWRYMLWWTTPLRNVK